MHIKITVLTVREGIRSHSQEHKILFQTGILDLLLQAGPKIPFSQHIPAYRFAAFFFQEGQCPDGNVIPFLSGQPSHGQDPISLKIILKAQSLLRHPPDPVLIHQIVEDRYFLSILRIYFQEMLFYLVRYGKYPVYFPVTVKIQFPGISGLFIINMDKCRFFLCLHMFSDIIGRPALQVSNCQIIFLPRNRCTIRKQTPA